MGNWSSDYINTGNLMLHYTRTGGDKPPLVLLHGYADNGLCWSRTALALEKNYDIIMPDFRNHGLSSVSRDGIVSFDMMQEMVEFIELLELDKPWLIGHSMGGRIAAMIGKEYPSLVSGLILEEPAFNFKPSRTLREVVIYFAFSFLLRSTRYKSFDEVKKIGKVSNPKWDSIDNETWALAQNQFAQLGQKPSLKGLKIDRVLYSDILPFIEAPTLIMVAENGIIPKKHLESLKNNLNEGEWVFYKKTGHNIHREKFDSFTNRVKYFIETSS
jgi:pimeloyl-ACP methyl ester carboxylesterase